jgi:ABC-type branched-subunit amino acid transport system substrate-binding protein
MVEWSRYTEGALVAKQFVQTGMNLLRFGSDGIATPKFIELAGAAADGIYFIPNPGSCDSGQGYPNQHLFDSTWRTKEVRHAYPASG